jgi:hypothetical protein
VERETVTQEFYGYEPQNTHNADQMGCLKGDPSNGGKKGII